MTHLQFAQPHWLWVGAICCAASAVLLVRADGLRRRALTALAGGRFVTTLSRGRRVLKQALVLTGVAATFVALARPLAGFRWEEERRDGIDLMFAVDTSKSMLATDLRPDRLTRAKLAVTDLLRKFPGERVGLIAFAGEAFVQAPMTIDQAVFGEALDALDTSVIPRGGTDIASPIRAAVEAMATEPDRRKLLVILSDGEDLQGEALAAAKEAAQAGLVIYTVGVGTKSGDLIPIEHDGRRELLRDAEGQFVTSHLDEQMLRRLAEITGGAYAPLGAAGQGLETLYGQHLAQLPRRTVEERLHKVYTERFQIPLGIAIGCLVLELALQERRRRGQAAGRRVRSSAADRPVGVEARLARSARPVGSVGPVGKTVAAAIVVMMAAASHAAAAATATPSATATAPALPPVAAATAVSTYNDGTAAYRKKDFAAARDRFQSATHTTDLSMQEDAYYDLGNARYRLGQASLSRDRAATIEAWKTAVASYDGALALQPRDADARFNRDLVARRLATLEQQQRQDQQQSKNQNQKNQKNQQAQNDQNGQNGQNGPKDQEQGHGKQPEASSGQGQQGEQGEQGQQGKNGQSSPQDGEGQPQQAAGEKGGGAKQEGAHAQDQGGQKGAETGEPRKAPPSSGSPDQTRPQGDPKSGASEGPRDPARPPQADRGPSNPQGPGIVSGQPGQPAGKEQVASARRDPGALTPTEATQLLDSMSGELHRLPVADARRRPPSNNDDTPLKDW